MRGNPTRAFTLGLIPTIFRNFFLCLGLTPGLSGFTYAPLTVVWSLGGILLSHPFEVARVLIQCNDKKSMFGSSWNTMKGIFATEGLVGLYRGAVPRTIKTLPPIVTYAMIDNLDVLRDFENGFPSGRLQRE